MRRALPAAALVTTLLLASCGTTGGADAPTAPSVSRPPTSGPVTAGSASPPSPHPPSPSAHGSGLAMHVTRHGPAARALRSAVRGLLRADTGRYVHRLYRNHQGPPLLQLTVDYRLSAGAVEATQIVRVPGQSPMRLENRLLGSRLYVKSPDAPEPIRRCWLTFDRKSMGQASGLTLLPSALRSPLSMDVLAGARGASYNPGTRGSIVGDVDLRTAANLMLPSLGPGVDWRRFRGRSSARFQVADGLVTDLVIEGHDVARGLAAAGFLLPGQVMRELSALHLEVAYSRPGRPVLVRRPPARLRMTPEQASSGQGCPAAALATG